MHFSMIQLARKRGRKFDKSLRRKIVKSYQPFRRMPCFMHNLMETLLMRFKRHRVVVQFDEHYTSDMPRLHQLATGTFRCSFHKEFPSIGCCSVTMTGHMMKRLLNSDVPIRKIYDDRRVEAFLDTARESINVTSYNQAGLTGSGTTIAIVDTGIANHPDLENPTNRLVAFHDVISGRTDAYDDNGHGTHCAGDAASNGYASDGLYQGPAPEANLVGVKVLDKMGAGSLSNIIEGVQWCIDHQEEHGINIISLSLGSSETEPAEDDLMVQIVERAWDAGMVVCAAAGNEGPDGNTIASPGTSPKIITVGAVDNTNTPDRSDDTVAEFSSRGPTMDGLTKPDLVTPGVDIVSWRTNGSFTDKTAKNSRVGDRYISLSGTSMATPICAGVVALVIQDDPSLTPDEIKGRLLAACEDIGQPENVQGQGYLNVDHLFQ
ncbi:S8 family peptidase [Shouchella shacheensis]|uniref:S8 family peptidase n=1 Tax=Shouchella shacheensis TaxID=1649580 RepID=UPI00073FFDA6|nr:S8 family peptidase [Shouchella shacheensis]